MKLILDLQSELFALESRSLQLDAELGRLKRQLDLRPRMHARPPFNYYFLDGDDVPCCPKCWESRGEAIHLSAHGKAFGKVRRDCPRCKEAYWEMAIIKGRSRAHHA